MKEKCIKGRKKPKDKWESPIVSDIEKERSLRWRKYLEKEGVGDDYMDKKERER